MHATTVYQVTTAIGSVTLLVSTKYVTEMDLTSTSATTSKSFFDSTAKVAGTFTAVGVVVVACLAALLYCCCFGAGRHDEFSDEENQYSSDESVSNEKAVPAPESAQLKRDNSSKSILLLFNTAPAAGIGRSLLKKRLNPSKEPDNGPMMFPILEFDTCLDPQTMFQSQNESKMSLQDENDYSRRILHIANPE